MNKSEARAYKQAYNLLKKSSLSIERVEGYAETLYNVVASGASYDIIASSLNAIIEEAGLTEDEGKAILTLAVLKERNKGG